MNSINFVTKGIPEFNNKQIKKDSTDFLKRAFQNLTNANIIAYKCNKYNKVGAKENNEGSFDQISEHTSQRIRDNFINAINLNNRVRVGVNKGNIISEKAEILMKSELANDVFENKDGILTVKLSDQSEIMKGHLGCNMPLVPGVVQLDLLINGSDIKNKGLAVKFENSILPNRKIVFVNNELHRYDEQSNYGDNTKILGFEIYDNDIKLPEDWDDKIEKLIKNKESMRLGSSDLDKYLLQEGAFRFINGNTKKDVVVDGDEFSGFWEIPSDFKRTKDGKVNPVLFIESAAQTGASFFGPSLNKGNALRERDRLNMESKILTFASSVHQSSCVDVQPGETVYVWAKILSCTDVSVDEKREAEKELKKFEKQNKDSQETIDWRAKVENMKTVSRFVYVVVNQDGKEIVRGEVQGNTVKIGPLKAMIDRAMR